MRAMSYLFISLFGVGVLSQVYGADDPPPAPDAKPVAAAPAAPAPAATPVPATDKTPLDQEFEEYAKKFKIREKDGQKVYCRNEAPLGTRMTRVVCQSEEQLREQVISMQEDRDVMRKRGVELRQQ
jgi:hypothetical protein